MHTFTLDGAYCSSALVPTDLSVARFCAFDVGRGRMCLADPIGSRVSVISLNSLVLDESAPCSFQTGFRATIRALCFHPHSGAILVAVETADKTCEIKEFARTEADNYTLRRVMECKQVQKIDTIACITADATRDRVWMTESDCSGNVIVHALDWRRSRNQLFARFTQRSSRLHVLLTDLAMDGALLVLEHLVARLDAACAVQATWSLPEIDQYDGVLTSATYHGPTNTLYLARGSRLRAMQLTTTSTERSTGVTPMSLGSPCSATAAKTLLL